MTNGGVQVGKAIKERTWKPTVAGILCEWLSQWA